MKGEKEMKKHMTLEQLFGTYSGSMSVYQNNGTKVENYSSYMKYPVYRIERYAEDIAVFLGEQEEEDKVDQLPEFEAILTMMTQNLEKWYENKKEELTRQIVTSGEYDDEILERCLASTEYSSIDEMTEKIDELTDRVEEMESDFYDIYTMADKYV